MRSREHNAELMSGFCTALADQGVGVRAIRNSRADVEELLRWIEANHGSSLEFADLTERELDLYREHLSQRFRPSTLRRKLATAKVFLGWVQRGSSRRVQSGKYTRGTPSSRREQLRWLNFHEIGQYRTAVEKNGTLEDRLMIAFLADVGLRIKEICGLRWDDVTIRDFSADFRVGEKAKHRVRTVQAVGKTVDLIRDWEREVHSASGLVFEVNGGPISPRSVRRLCERFGRISGLAVTPFELRRSLSVSLRHFRQERGPGLPFHSGALAMDGLDTRVQAARSREKSSYPRRRLVPDDTYMDIVVPEVLITQANDEAVFTSVRSGIRRDRKIREQVLKRANGTCQRCGFRFANPNLLQIHHIVAAAEKRDNVSNCVALCPTCHCLAHYVPEQAEIEIQLLLIVRGERLELSGSRTPLERLSRRSSAVRMRS
ncbi:tyrosine-type recombinase/integrase [Occallatibacter riparius]|uniref:tyrosine-type recombinase/integrase n=1 Tax=Occallatibacter riparius TaxID=1002689 RepID=UPI0036F22580